MTSNTAKNPPKPRLVLFVVYPNIVLLDLSGPLQVFSHTTDPKTEELAYTCAVASLTGGPIETNTILSVQTSPLDHFLNRPIHTLVIVGGDGANAAMTNDLLINNVKALAENAQRVCSVCSGALVLAATGLLDGRRAVTHWEDCEGLQRLYPLVQVEVDPIYIKDGTIWTSAGITSGMDMALAMVVEDLGRPAAMKIARSMVTHMIRSGGQSQFSSLLTRQLQDVDARFEALHDWIADNIEKDLRVEVLADQANMSPRNFSRLYSRDMGVTPAKAVEAMRTERARDMLGATDFSIKRIAEDCGFHDEERLRRAFLRLLRVSPSQYRKQFRVT
jgi:transcriptional regulator GlxA family with amidase domain